MIDEQQKTKFRRSARARLLAACSAAAILVVGLGAATQAHAPVLVPVSNMAAHEAPPSERATTPRMLENGAPFSFADLVERVSPAVVTVTVEEQVTAQQGINPEDLPEPFRDFFNQFGGGGGGGDGARPFMAPRKAVAMGSGFIIDKSGLIVTNN